MTFLSRLVTLAAAVIAMAGTSSVPADTSPHRTEPSAPATAATPQLRGYAKPSSRQVHGLIMAIGEYDAPIPKLKGVRQDVQSAIEIARRMGVADENLRVYRDRELTLSGMRQAFDDLESRLQENDQVFIYFSGHGGRSLAIEETPGDRCAESLIAYDDYGLRDAELEMRLKRIAGKAQKIIAFIDACHSGGVTTRGRASAPGGLTAKYWNGKDSGGSDACTRPTNVLTRSLAQGAKTAGLGNNNFVYIAASRADEISFDDANRGGIATQAWLECMQGAARDLDGSGGLSAEEIRICAQQKVESKLRRVANILPSHITINGNADMVLSYALRGEATSQPPALAKPSPQAALKDIHSNRDDRRKITLTAEKRSLRIGRDSFALTMTSQEAGYVYLLMAGSDGEAFDLLFPNAIDHNNRIAAGETLRLPGHGWQLAAQGPAGKDLLLAIVADAPRDFSPVGLKPTGAFSIIAPVAAKDIQLVTASAPIGSDDACGKPTTSRNLEVVSSCSSAYGAALLSIDEVTP